MIREDGLDDGSHVVESDLWTDCEEVPEDESGVVHPWASQSKAMSFATGVKKKADSHMQSENCADIASFSEDTDVGSSILCLDSTSDEVWPCDEMFVREQVEDHDDAISSTSDEPLPDDNALFFDEVADTHLDAVENLPHVMLWHGPDCTLLPSMKLNNSVARRAPRCLSSRGQRQADSSLDSSMPFDVIISV
jgi:hypothetical protein